MFLSTVYEIWSAKRKPKTPSGIGFQLFPYITHACLDTLQISHFWVCHVHVSSKLYSLSAPEHLMNVHPSAQYDHEGGERVIFECYLQGCTLFQITNVLALISTCANRC